MSTICGIFRRDGQPVPQETIATMTAVLGHWRTEADRSDTWRNPAGTVALGHVMLTNTPESSAEILPFFDATSRLAITATARIDNRPDLLRQLDIPWPERASIPDSQLILQAYRQWGPECAAHLVGEFAFAIWDEGEKRLFCARDHLGHKPVYYFANEDLFLFATEIKGIFQVQDLPRTLDPDWIGDALTVLVADKEYTPYRDIRRLPPAHWFSITPEQIHKERYWDLDPQRELHFSSEAEYVAEFREKLEEAVRCRMRSAFPVGSELSGGLDSSAVTAIAARQAQAQNLKFVAFSHVLGEATPATAGSMPDESVFQDLLRHHARIHHSYSLASHERGIIASLKEALLVQDGPSHRAYGGFAGVIHEAAAQEGVRTLLSGFGGDEVVSHQANEFLDELAHRQAWRQLWQEIHCQPGKRHSAAVLALLNKIAGEYLPTLKSAYLCARARLLEFRENSPARHLELFPVTPGFYENAHLRNRLATIPRLPGGKDVRTSQYRRILHSHVPVRLEYCSIEASAHRLEYRYPLLDIRLLEFHLATPASLKRKAGYGRYLFRRAIDGIVPPAIQWRVDKTGAAVPGSRLRILRDVQSIHHLIFRARHTQAAKYIDLDQLSKRFQAMVSQEKHQAPLRQGVFLNALKLLLYFDQDPTAR